MFLGKKEILSLLWKVIINQNSFGPSGNSSHCRIGSRYEAKVNVQTYAEVEEGGGEGTV